MRLICASDTHGSSLALAKIGGMARESNADCILLAGDIVVHSFYNGFVDLLAKMSEHGKCPCICVPGNHDFWRPHKYFDRKAGDGHYFTSTEDYDVRCLVDSFAFIRTITNPLVTAGIPLLKVWGTPWTKYCGKWNYMLDTEDQLAEKFEQIPMDTDILITHSPPYGFGDYCDAGRIGSEALTQAIQKRPNLKLCVFGHNHDCFGWEGKIGDTVLCNVACHDKMYQFRWEGIKIIDL